MGKKSRSRSSSPARRKKDKEKEKDKDRGSKRSRSGRKEKEKEKEKDKDRDKDRDREKNKEKDRDKEKDKDRDRDRDRDKDKDRDKDRDRDRDKEKEKDRDRDRDRDREKDKDRDKAEKKKAKEKRASSGSRSPSRSRQENAANDSSGEEGGTLKLWPIVVATSRRTLQLLVPAMELYPEVVPTEIAVGAKSRQVVVDKPSMLGPPGGLMPLPAPGAGLSQSHQPGSMGFGLPPGFTPTGRPDNSYTGASLAQQHGKQQICFNFVGGRCFRDNCRFLHLGPGGPGGARPPAQTFTGVMMNGGGGGFS